MQPKRLTHSLAEAICFHLLVMCRAPSAPWNPRSSRDFGGGEAFREPNQQPNERGFQQNTKIIETNRAVAADFLL